MSEIGLITLISISVNCFLKSEKKNFDENFQFDRTCSGDSKSAYMDNTPYQKLLTPVHHIIGLILTFLVFILMSILLVPFTFSTNALIAQGQACLTATPITAVFWFAYNMFMVVLLDQKKQKK